MSRARDLAMLELLCSSGVDLITQMPLLSEVLHRLVPSFSLSMIRVDERCVPQSHSSEHFDEASHALFAERGEHFAARGDDPAGFANLMAKASPIGNLLGVRPEYTDGLIYQHLFKPNGIHHTLDVALRDRGEPLAILGIFRERAAQRFSREHVHSVPGGRLSLRGYALDAATEAPEGYVGIQVRLEVDRTLRQLRALDALNLTPQQLRIAWGLSCGQSNAALCASLEVSAATLKSYQKDMYRRLEVSGARELKERVVELGTRVRLDRERHWPRTPLRHGPR